MKYYAAPTGSDSGPGTREHPFKSAGRLLLSLESGDTGILLQGVYSGNIQIRVPEITLRSPRGQHATIRGGIRIESTAAGAKLEGLILDGRNDAGFLSPLIYADDVVIKGCDVSNHHTAIGIHVAHYYGQGTTGVKILGNRIHHNGRLPATNHDHGIYLLSSRDCLIEGNWFFRNADRGVQAYLDVHGTVCQHNLIAYNGQGIIVGGDESGGGPTDNLFTHNAITDSNVRHNVEYSGALGAGNRAVENVVWSPLDGYYGGNPAHSGLQPSTQGFYIDNNRVHEPQYRNADKGDFRVPESDPAHGYIPKLAKWLRELPFDQARP